MKVIVVGAGPSGLTAAIAAARCGASVTILEQNERPGKKILATGNGKCNLSNKDHSLNHFHTQEREILETILSNTGFEDALSFWKGLGLSLREKGGWLYPRSEQASSVLNLLLWEAAELKIKIKTRERVLYVKKNADGFQVQTEGWTYTSDAVILSAGGPASAIEGSDRTGMDMACAFGLKLIEPLPALVPLKGKENYYSKWAGARVEGELQLSADGRCLAKERGEILFADYGISGIAVFQLSGYAAKALQKGQQVEIFMDLFPDESRETLEYLLKEKAALHPRRSMEELLNGLIPDKIIDVLKKKKLSDPGALAAFLKHWIFPVKSTHSLKRAQVCSGGISLREIDPSTMESVKVPGLYLTGEILDVYGDCGGYNLQWCWSTGLIAGKACGERKSS